MVLFSTTAFKLCPEAKQKDYRIIYDTFYGSKILILHEKFAS